MDCVIYLVEPIAYEPAMETEIYRTGDTRAAMDYLISLNENPPENSIPRALQNGDAYYSLRIENRYIPER